MNIADQDVKAGTYTLYTIPEKDQWTVILNSKTGSWGAYDYDDSEDVARFTVPVKESPTTLEAFSMSFIHKDQGASLLMGWGDRFVKVPFKVTP